MIPLFAYIYITRSIASIRLSTFLRLLQQIRKECVAASPLRPGQLGWPRLAQALPQSIANVSRNTLFKRGEMRWNLNFAGCYRAAPHLRNNRLPQLCADICNNRSIDHNCLNHQTQQLTDGACACACPRVRVRQPMQECGEEQKVKFSANLACTFLNFLILVRPFNTNSVIYNAKC